MVPGWVGAVNLWTLLLNRRYYFLIMASYRLKRQVERLLDEAEQALTDRDWEVVRQRARDVLAFDLDNSEAETFLRGAERALEAVSPSLGAPTQPEVDPGRAKLEGNTGFGTSTEVV